MRRLTYALTTLALVAVLAPQARAQSYDTARAYHLNNAVTLHTHKINGSRVRVATAPVTMLDALPGCKRHSTCGRQMAMLPSQNGARHGAVVAIGGDFVRNGQTVHPFIHDGRLYNRGVRQGDVFRLMKDGSAEIQRGRPRFIHRRERRQTEEMFGGYPQVLDDGRVPRNRGDCKNSDGPDGAFCLRQPRQGVGLSRDGTRVIVIEVDGHQRGSRGMLLPEFGHLFRRYGAYDALNVDGGGSAVMWTRHRTRACTWRRPVGCLVSKPYLGEERRVAQAISINP